MGELKDGKGRGGGEDIAQAAVDGRHNGAEGYAGDLGAGEEQRGEAAGKTLLGIIEKGGAHLALAGHGVVGRDEAVVGVGVANVDAEKRRRGRRMTNDQ